MADNDCTVHPCVPFTQTRREHEEIIVRCFFVQRGVRPVGSDSFEAADIRVSAPSSNTNIRGGVARGGRYEVGNATMVQLISMASAARAGD